MRGVGSSSRGAKRFASRLAVSAISVVGGAVGLGLAAAPAGATACSASAGNASCTVSGSVTVTAGTLTLVASPSLYWDQVLSGYDQWASGSSATLTGCSVQTSGTTSCSSGAAPMLLAIDATGSGSGWNVNAYPSGSTLPASSKLSFDGAGSSTYGDTTVSAVGVDPFASTAPGTECDAASSCTNASTPTSFPVDFTSATSGTPAKLYSAAASSGGGAVCFGTGSVSGHDCAGTTNTAFVNLGVPASATAGADSVTINLAISSGP